MSPRFNDTDQQEQHTVAVVAALFILGGNIVSWLSDIDDSLTKNHSGNNYTYSDEEAIARARDLVAACRVDGLGPAPQPPPETSKDG